MEWQLYADLEYETEQLMKSITFNSDQRKVYSPKIAELIVRIGFQIESVSQLLSSNSRKKVNYRTHINNLCKKCQIDKKIIIMDKHKVYTEDDGRYGYVISPFKYQEDKTSWVGGKQQFCTKKNPDSFSIQVPKRERCQAYRWENAYNNLKHNFYENISRYGNVDNLLRILSALYILNIYADKELKIINRYDGYQIINQNTISEKSNIFSVLTLSALIDGDKICFEYPIKKTTIEDYCFIDIKSLSLYKDHIINMFGPEWEPVIETKNWYKIPNNIKSIINAVSIFNKFSIIMRNTTDNNLLTSSNNNKNTQ